LRTYITRHIYLDGENINKFQDLYMNTNLAPVIFFRDIRQLCFKGPTYKAFRVKCAIMRLSLQMLTSLI